MADYGEILSNRDLSVMMSDALCLLESDLYMTDIDDHEGVFYTANGMASLVNALLSVKKAERDEEELREFKAKMREMEASADNPDYDPDDDNFEDMPPDDYEADS